MQLLMFFLVKCEQAQLLKTSEKIYICKVV